MVSGIGWLFFLPMAYDMVSCGSCFCVCGSGCGRGEGGLWHSSLFFCCCCWFSCVLPIPPVHFLLAGDDPLRTYALHRLYMFLPIEQSHGDGRLTAIRCVCVCSVGEWVSGWGRCLLLSKKGVKSTNATLTCPFLTQDKPKF